MVVNLGTTGMLGFKEFGKNASCELPCVTWPLVSNMTIVNLRSSVIGLGVFRLVYESARVKPVLTESQAGHTTNNLLES